MQTKYRFDTIAHKIEFFSAILTAVENTQSKFVFLCHVANWGLDDSKENDELNGATYRQWIQNELIKDGKVTRSVTGYVGHGFDDPKGNKDIRIAYLKEKIQTLQNQLNKENESMQNKPKTKHIPIGRRYLKTIETSGWSNDQFNSLHRGQWVKNFGSTGQFLGITAQGTVTINYKQTEDKRKQYAANKPLRQFVILHGGK